MISREEAARNVVAAEDQVFLHGLNADTQAGLDAAMATWAEVAMEDGLQRMLLRMLGEALEREPHFRWEPGGE